MTKTNWFVFTGAASSGKTTMISLFSSLGYYIKNEVVREYLNSTYESKIPIDQIPWSSPSFQKKLLTLKLDREKILDPDQIILFDRGVLDVYAYSSLRGISTSDIYSEHTYRYKAIFLFESLPITYDNLRRDTAEDAILQWKSLRNVYKKSNYLIIDVPRFSNKIEESIALRQQFIENEIQKIISTNRPIDRTIQ